MQYKTKKIYLLKKFAKLPFVIFTFRQVKDLFNITATKSQKNRKMRFFNAIKLYYFELYHLFKRFLLNIINL